MPSVIHNCCNQLGFIIHSTPPAWASPRQEGCYCIVIIIYLIIFFLPFFHNTFYWVVSECKKRFFTFQDPRNSEYNNKNKIHPGNLAFRRKLFDTLFKKKSLTLSLFVKNEQHKEVIIISSSRYIFQIYIFLISPFPPL